MSVDDRPPPAADPATAEPERRPSADDVDALTAVDLLFIEARAAVAQEVSLIRALAAAGAVTGRNVAVLIVAAVLVALVALMTLALGAMFALAGVLGFGAATAIVVSALCLIGAILVLMIRREIGRFRKAAGRGQP